MKLTSNNGHELKIYNIFDKKDYIIEIGIIFLFLFTFIMSFFNPGLSIISYFFFFGFFGYAFVFFLKRSNEKLQLTLELLESSQGVYEWREVYRLKSDLENLDNNFLWRYKNKLVPFFDLTKEQPDFFNPYIKPVPNIKSVNIARAKEQSSARRLFSPKSMKAGQVFQLLFFLVAGGGLIFGIHVLITGGG